MSVGLFCNVSRENAHNRVCVITETLVKIKQFGMTTYKKNISLTVEAERLTPILQWTSTLELDILKTSSNYFI